MVSELARRLNRFFDKVSFDGDPIEDCWSWSGGKDGQGYGKFNDYARTGEQRAHRYIYKELVGPIPEGLELAHQCFRTSCCNPWHVKPMTHQGNLLQPNPGVSYTNYNKTHCKNGHELSGENIRMEGSSRRCKACKVAYDKARWESLGRR